MLENAKVLEARRGNEVDIYSSIIDKVITMTDAVVEKVNDKYTKIYTDTELKYLDNTGKIVENTEVYKNLNLYSYSNEEGKWGFKNKAGEVIVEANYDMITELNEFGFAGIKAEGKWGVIDQEGNIIVEPSYKIESYYAPSFIGQYLLEENENVFQCIEIERSE